MQQRQLRLGDILDDYCPRERRVTNHAVVAMIDQEVKQTRCTTCDTEHEYKQARVPPQRKKKEAPGVLYQDVLAAMPRKAPTSTPATDALDEIVPDDDPHGDMPAESEATSVAAGAGLTDEAEGPVHRPLIRATLPRPDGQPTTRPIPEFTARTAVTRPGRFRPGASGPGRRGPAGANGQPTGNPHAFRGRRGSGPAVAGQQAHGNRPRPAHGERQAQHRRQGGKKRSK
jgi:hypothetical protein